jgi:hypothetical protein
MHETNHVPPERLTAEQRRHEVAFLLAKGLVRLRDSSFDRIVKDVPESEFVLGFASQLSVHGDSTNNTNTESK